MNKFYIITNNEKDKNLEFTDRVVDYLGKRGGQCEVQLAGRQTAGPFHYTDPRKIPEETQCIIVLGGDGTLLQAARDIQAAHDKKRSQIPLLGVNLGNLGFLAEVDRQSVYQALDKLDRGCLRGGRENDALRDCLPGRQGQGSSKAVLPQTIHCSLQAEGCPFVL